MRFMSNGFEMCTATMSPQQIESLHNYVQGILEYCRNIAYDFAISEHIEMFTRRDWFIPGDGSRKACAAEVNKRIEVWRTNDHVKALDVLGWSYDADFAGLLANVSMFDSAVMDPTI